MGRSSKQRWSDPERAERVARAGVLAAGVVQVGLLGAALTDLRRRPRAEVNGPKAMWVAVSFVNFVGPLAYFAFGRRAEAASRDLEARVPTGRAAVQRWPGEVGRESRAGDQPRDQ